MIICRVNELDYESFFRDIKNAKLYKKRKKEEYIANLTNSFDIETTSMIYQGEKIGFMYLWGFSFFNKYIVVGRYWSEFMDFMKKLLKFLNDNCINLVIYIHNASFEFAFMYHYLNKLGKVKYFATDKNKILDFKIGMIEFRCSYRLTNLSLAKACDKYQTHTHKLNKDDNNLDLDYLICRTPETPLKESEKNYFINDLVSVVEIVDKLLEMYGDTIVTIPRTATGYIRRITRKACNKWSYRNWFKSLELPLEVMELCILNKKGGDTHTNRFKFGQVFTNIDSYDIKSSYPFQLLTKYFPVSTFKYKKDFKDRFDYYIRRMCCLFLIKIDEIEIKPFNEMTILSRSHIVNESSAAVKISDNGRVVRAFNCILCLNEIDYMNIRRYYNIKGEHIIKGYVARRGRLPKELREVIFNTFKEKCDLEDVKGTDREYLYSNKKAELNAIYGMMLTSILHDSFELKYNDDNELEWTPIKKTDYERAKELREYFEKYSHFLYYPIGLYVVSHARTDLYDLCDCCKRHLYHDTDSCKGYEWDYKKLEEFNNIRKQKCIDNDIVYKDIYLGTCEHDAHYDLFTSYGAKKYAYEEDGKIGITIAGCNKKCKSQLKSVYDLEEGFVFKDATNQAVYSLAEIRDITVDGCTFSTGGGVYICKGDYTLEYCDDYLNKICYTIYEEGISI